MGNDYRMRIITPTSFGSYSSLANLAIVTSNDMLVPTTDFYVHTFKSSVDFEKHIERYNPENIISEEKLLDMIAAIPLGLGEDKDLVALKAGLIGCCNEGCVVQNTQRVYTIFNILSNKGNPNTDTDKQPYFPSVLTEELVGKLVRIGSLNHDADIVTKDGILLPFNAGSHENYWLATIVLLNPLTGEMQRIPFPTIITAEDIHVIEKRNLLRMAYPHTPYSKLAKVYNNDMEEYQRILNNSEWVYHYTSDLTLPVDTGVEKITLHHYVHVLESNSTGTLSVIEEIPLD